MLWRQIEDWDDAYANMAHIPGGADYPARWQARAAAFRAERPPEVIGYGPGERQRLDLFRPAGDAKGLAAFVHGGYWLRFGREFWSHLAAGPLARGWAVAMPSYTLAPAARIGAIIREIAAVVECAAEQVPGPIRLTGHSAGGHLVTRMVSGALDGPAAARITGVVSISGVHDLRPLLATSMAADLRLDAEEANTESPALLIPREGTRVTCWVGGAERAEFLRQNALLANAWTGLGAATREAVEPDRHHFNVIDGLENPESPLTQALLAD